MIARLLLLAALSFHGMDQQPRSDVESELRARLEKAYLADLNGDAHAQACKTYLEIATSDDASAEIHATALMHYADHFDSCSKAAPSHYQDPSTIYTAALKSAANDGQRALALNNLAVALYGSNRDEAIRQLEAIPFDNIPALTRVEYRLNLARLYSRADRPMDAALTYRRALGDGGDPHKVAREMIDLAGSLPIPAVLRSDWQRTVGETVVALSDTGARDDGIALIRACFAKDKRLESAPVLLESLLNSLAALPLELTDFPDSSAEKQIADSHPVRYQWLFESRNERLIAVASAARLKMGQLETLDNLRHFRELIDSPESQTIFARWQGPGLFVDRSYDLRRAFSRYLYRLGDAWVRSDPKDNDVRANAQARYTLAWTIWPENLAAAAQSAEMAVASPEDPESKGTLTELRTRYRLKNFNTAYLTGAEMTSLFSLYTYLADASKENRGVFKDAISIRNRLVKNGFTVPPAPMLFQLMAKNATDSGLAGSYYFDAAHDYERLGALDAAQESLSTALQANPELASFAPRLSPGQTGMVGYLSSQSLEAIRIQSSPGENPTPLPDNSWHISEDHKFFQATFPKALTEGSKIAIEMAGKNPIEALVPINDHKAEIHPLMEGADVIEGYAPLDTQWILVEVKLPSAMCAKSSVGGKSEKEFLVQSEVASVDPDTGAFRVRLGRSLRSGEIVSVRDLHGKYQPLNNVPEVGNMPFDWGPLRLYATVGVQLFDPQGASKAVVFPNASGTLDLLLFSRHLALTHPLCPGQTGPRQAFSANTYGEVRIEPITAVRTTTGNTAAVERVPLGRVLEAGTYFPYVPPFLRYQYRGASYAPFLAPIGKIGMQYPRPLQGSGDYWAAGLRAGTWRFTRTDGKAAPILTTRADFTVGRWNSFNTPDISHARLRYDLEITGKLEPFPHTLSMRINFGPGPNDYRFGLGLRFELADLVQRVRRTGFRAILL
jgi:hypothetical protein